MAEAEMVAQIDALGVKLAAAKTSITKRFIGQERVVDLCLRSATIGRSWSVGWSARVGQNAAC